MKIGILTSSRADFSIYLPLLKKLKSDSFFDLHILAFGTHLSHKFGKTVNAIKNEGFNSIYQITGAPKSDLPIDIVLAQSKTITSFAKFWQSNTFDLVFALGDRFEMFAAVASTLPFNIKIAHLHGGETTLGAIDNAYRHSISHMSTLHFVSCQTYKKRLIQILGTTKNIYKVGALSIDNLKSLKLLSISELNEKFNINFSTPTILFTFHPETIKYELNKQYITEVLSAFNHLTHYQIVITMPNADTMGNTIRTQILAYSQKNKHVKTIESFGTVGYLSAMKHCKFMLGNTSSAFVEASFFAKPAINLGNRQDGRKRLAHIFDTPINQEAILNQVKVIEKLPVLTPVFEYGNGKAAQKIISVLKQKYLEKF